MCSRGQASFNFDTAKCPRRYFDPGAPLPFSSMVRRVSTPAPYSGELRGCPVAHGTPRSLPRPSYISHLVKPNAFHTTLNTGRMMAGTSISKRST
jgi:hypothetical protein